ncbi:MAG: proton-conducting membrane transporter, partial [Fibrobacter sp.]|nr:proton-conducting membrane transporter [Fibrobacter sp.]
AISKNTPEADSVLAELKFSKGYKPVLGIALGYKDESPDAKPRDPSKVKFID